MGTRVGFVADCHIANHRLLGGRVHAGINRRCRMALDALQRACEAAADADVSALVVCGDTFDNVRPEPQVIAAVAQVLGRCPFPVFVLLGNHEIVSMVGGDHALGPLEEVSNVTVVDTPRIVPIGDAAQVLLWCAPYRPGPGKVWLPVVMAQLGAQAEGWRQAGAHPKNTVVRSHLLATHLGIMDDKTPPYLRDAHDCIGAFVLDEIMQAHGIELAAAGNWHDHRAWEFVDGPTGTARHIVQCGALVPTGFDNPGLDGYGSLIVSESAGGKTTWVRAEIRGPRFLTVQADEDDTLFEDAAKQVAPGSLFVCRKAEPTGLQSAVARMLEAELALGLAGQRVVVDTKAAKVARGLAAQGASMATTVDGAVSAYIDGLVLPPGVERDVLGARVERLLTNSP